MFVGISLATIVLFEAVVILPFASIVTDGIVPTVFPYCADVTPVMARVSTPVLIIEASPERATPVAIFVPFPTNIFPLVSVEVSLLLKVVQSVLVR